MWSRDLIASQNTTTVITKPNLRQLDADAEGASKQDMARPFLGIDPSREPDRAPRAVETPLDRALWMTKRGYRLLLRRA